MHLAGGRPPTAIPVCDPRPRLAKLFSRAECSLLEGKAFGEVRKNSLPARLGGKETLAFHDPSGLVSASCPLRGDRRRLQPLRSVLKASEGTRVFAAAKLNVTMIRERRQAAGASSARLSGGKGGQESRTVVSGTARGPRKWSWTPSGESRGIWIQSPSSPVTGCGAAGE